MEITFSVTSKRLSLTTLHVCFLEFKSVVTEICDFYHFDSINSTGIIIAVFVQVSSSWL